MDKAMPTPVDVARSVLAEQQATLRERLAVVCADIKDMQGDLAGARSLRDAIVQGIAALDQGLGLRADGTPRVARAARRVRADGGNL